MSETSQAQQAPPAKKNELPPTQKPLIPRKEILEANLLFLPKDLADRVRAAKPIYTAVEKEIKVGGLNNPLYLALVGFGTRQVLEAAFEFVTPSGRIKDISFVLIVEPSLERFRGTLECECLQDLFENDRIDFIVGQTPDEMQPDLYKIFTKCDPILGNRVARARTPEIVLDTFVYPLGPDGKIPKEASKYVEAIQTGAKQAFLAMGCSSDTKYRWDLLFTNQKAIQEAYRIEPLFNSAKDEAAPAIVLGAGPSLEEFIEIDKQHKLSSKSLVIASDAALKRLLKENIRPHMVIRCERKWTKIFDGLTKKDTDGIYYIFYPWNAPEFIELFDKKIAAFRTNGPCNWSEYKPGSVDGGVSAANAAIEVAYKMGFQEIYLSGVDLCFIDDKSHLEGTEVEFDINKSKDKWQKIEGNSGEVTSIPVWQRCLYEYIGQIARHPEVKTINTSTKGAKISGTKVMPWSEALHRFKGKFEFEKYEKLLDKHGPEAYIRFQAKRLETAKKLREVRHEIQKLVMSVKDHMMTIDGEEIKAVMQICHSVAPADFFLHVKEVRKQLADIFIEPCRQIDAFKQKWFNDQDIQYLLLDMCQIDLFHAEHKAASLKNQCEWDHDRLRKYSQVYVNLLALFGHYSAQMIELMEKGPPVGATYTEEGLWSAV